MGVCVWLIVEKRIRDFAANHPMSGRLRRSFFSTSKALRRKVHEEVLTLKSIQTLRAPSGPRGFVAFHLTPGKATNLFFYHESTKTQSYFILYCKAFCILSSYRYQE